MHNMIDHFKISLDLWCGPQFEWWLHNTLCIGTNMAKDLQVLFWLWLYSQRATVPTSWCLMITVFLTQLLVTVLPVQLIL